jgi:hypothetical protein
MANLREKVSAEEENINQTLNDLQSALARPERTIIERAALATFRCILRKSAKHCSSFAPGKIPPKRRWTWR